MEANADSGRARQLRSMMVGELRQLGVLRSSRTAEAFERVPRDRFAPGESLEQVYAARSAVVTKRNQHGLPVSSVSAPEIQAFMLEQAEVVPGMVVCEVGSGGYNAALLAELVGPQGSVTSVDIDSEVTERAERLLAAAGYAQVRVVCADAAAELGEQPRYDRILVTAGAWDIPPLWIDRLAECGRLVVPLRMRGLTRSLALERSGEHLVARSAWICGFVPMQGAAAHAERLLLLRGPEVGLRFDDDDGGGLSPADVHRLDGVLGTERQAAWSGVTVGGLESFETLQFWLATSLPGFCRLAVAPGQAEGLVDAAQRWFPLAVLDVDAGDSFAFLVSRPARCSGVFEFGAHGFGPHARAVAEAMVEQVRVWDRRHRKGPGPRFEVWPPHTTDEALPDQPDELILTKRHSRITISWPAGESAVREEPMSPNPGKGE